MPWALIPASAFQVWQASAVITPVASVHRESSAPLIPLFSAIWPDPFLVPLSDQPSQSLILDHLIYLWFCSIYLSAYFFAFNNLMLKKKKSNLLLNLSKWLLRLSYTLFHLSGIAHSMYPNIYYSSFKNKQKLIIREEKDNHNDILPHVCQISKVKSVWQVGRRIKREGTYVYLWLIHVDILYTQYNAAAAKSLQ